MRYFCAMLLLVLFAGCQHTQAPGTSDLGFSTDQAQYTPGADVQLQLDNQTDQAIGYNLCFSTLEQQTDQGWESLKPSRTVCTADQKGLPPGDSASFTKTLMRDLPEGTYRFMTEVEYRNSNRREPLRTNSFSVES